MGMLLSFIPQELFILVFLGAALGVILGLVRPGTVVGLIACVVILPVLFPIIGSFIDSLPWWVSLLLMIGFFLSIFSWVMSMLFEERTWDHVSALLIHDLLLGPFRLMGYLIRGGRR